METNNSDITTLPQFVDRRRGAEIVTRRYFPTSPRTLERWPVPRQHVNGKAVMETAALLDYARKLFEAAPPIMAGEGRRVARTVSAQHTV